MIAAPLWGLAERPDRPAPGADGEHGGGGACLSAARLRHALWMLFAARAFAGICAGNIAAAQAYIADVTPPEGAPAAWG